MKLYAYKPRRFSLIYLLFDHRANTSLSLVGLLTKLSVCKRIKRLKQTKRTCPSLPTYLYFSFFFAFLRMDHPIYVLTIMMVGPQLRSCVAEGWCGETCCCPLSLQARKCTHILWSWICWPSCRDIFSLCAAGRAVFKIVRHENRKKIATPQNREKCLF